MKRKDGVYTCKCGQRFRPRNLTLKWGKRFLVSGKDPYVECQACGRKVWLTKYLTGNCKY